MRLYTLLEAFTGWCHFGGTKGGKSLCVTELAASDRMFSIAEPIGISHYQGQFIKKGISFLKRRGRNPKGDE